MQTISMIENVLMQLPAQISVLKGPDHVITLVNPAAQQMLGTRQVTGLTAREAFPELEGQGFFEMLDEVYSTRKTIVHKAMPARVILEAKLQELYVDITYLPWIDGDGNVAGVISFTYDVSEAERAKHKLQETAEQLRHSYEDLEVKVKFRNLELEKKILELQSKLKELTGT